VKRYPLKAALILVGLVSGFTGVLSQAKEPEAMPGEFVVKMKSQMKLQDFHEYVKHTIPDLNMIVVKRPIFETRESAIQTLSQNPNIEYVEPNYIYRASKTPDDPMLGQLWGLSNTGAEDSSGQAGVAGVDIGAEQAWDIETGNDKTLVAVIDSGIDYNNPEIQNNIWTNKAEAKGKPGIDDDKNGIIDDIHGADFSNPSHPTGDPLDGFGHGTHCAGTIGAVGNDGKGLVGVAWKTKIMAAKFLDKDGHGTLDGALMAINYATKMNAKIMNNSWGAGAYSKSLLEVITRAHKANALFVAAAGNESKDNDSNDPTVIPAYPASYNLPNILSVAAVDNTGKLASFSNYGRTKVHVAAPGVNIVSITNQSYESLSGTSMATPHVTGVAVLLAAHFPNMKNTQIRNRIISTAKAAPALNKKILSGGIANAYTALMNISPTPDMNNPTYWNSKDVNYSTPHPYADNSTFETLIQVPGAKEISIYFAKFTTEPEASSKR